MFVRLSDREDPRRDAAQSCVVGAEQRVKGALAIQHEASADAGGLRVTSRGLRRKRSSQGRVQWERLIRLPSCRASESPTLGTASRRYSRWRTWEHVPSIRRFGCAHGMFGCSGRAQPAPVGSWHVTGSLRARKGASGDPRAEQRSHGIAPSPRYVESGSVRISSTTARTPSLEESITIRPSSMNATSIGRDTGCPSGSIRAGGRQATESNPAAERDSHVLARRMVCSPTTVASSSLHLRAGRAAGVSAVAVTLRRGARRPAPSTNCSNRDQRLVRRNWTERPRRGGRSSIMTLEKSETPTQTATSIYVPLRRACSKCALPSRPMNCTVNVESVTSRLVKPALAVAYRSRGSSGSTL